MLILELDELKKKKDSYITQIFWLGLQIAFIFAIPAVTAVLVGKKIDARLGEGKKFSLIFLLFAFILSWVITFVIYNRYSKQLKKVEEDISAQKKLDKLHK